MIDLIFANKGTGKTTYLAKLAKHYTKTKKYEKVFCNVPIKGTYKFDTKDIGTLHIENCLYLVDEGAIHFSNLKQLPKRQIDWFILSRHYQCDIVIISQSWDNVNITIRRLYDRIYIMQRPKIFFTSWSSLVKINKRIELDEETHQIVDGYFKTFPLPFVTRKIFYRPLYYKLFDSYDKEMLQSFEPEQYTFKQREKRKKLLSKPKKQIKDVDSILKDMNKSYDAEYHKV